MKFIISGPTLDVGRRGPTSAVEKLNQGTVRLVNDGEEGTLQSKLTIDKDDTEPAWNYVPPVAEFLCFEVLNEAGARVMPMQSMRGPAAEKELTEGNNQLFHCDEYGLSSFKFPRSLSPGIEPVKLILRWFINPAIGEGELVTGIIIEGRDHGLVDAVTWK
jgi:hypothetical protein